MRARDGAREGRRSKSWSGNGVGDEEEDVDDVRVSGCMLGVEKVTMMKTWKKFDEMDYRFGLDRYRPKVDVRSNETQEVFSVVFKA